MDKLGIIGSGDLGVQVLHIARQQNQYEIAGFFDDGEIGRTEKHGIRMLGPLSAIEKHVQDGRVDCLILAVGYKNMAARQALFERFSPLGRFATVVHPHSFIDPTAALAPGAIIYPGTIIDMNVVIRENVVVNNGCIISHDSTIGAHSFLAPHTAIAGCVAIGSCAYLGISTTVIDHVSLTDHVQTGGGCVVIRNLQRPGLYVGNPARFIR